jgi:hypothetical protein
MYVPCRRDETRQTKDDFADIILKLEGVWFAVLCHRRFAFVETPVCLSVCLYVRSVLLVLVCSEHTDTPLASVSLVS